MTRLDKIEARLAKCSPWPWHIASSVCYVEDSQAEDVANAVMDYDADFIAHSPADIAALVKVAKAARDFADGGTDYLLCIPADSPAVTKNMDILQAALNELNESEG